MYNINKNINLTIVPKYHNIILIYNIIIFIFIKYKYVKYV